MRSAGASRQPKPLTQPLETNVFDPGGYGRLDTVARVLIPNSGHQIRGKGRGESAGGINASKPKSQLYEDAKRAGIAGRSRMSKAELVGELQRHSDRESARARS